MVIVKVPFPLGAASEVAYQDSAMVGDSGWTVGRCNAGSWILGYRGKKVIYREMLRLYTGPNLGSTSVKKTQCSCCDDMSLMKDFKCPR